MHLSNLSTRACCAHPPDRRGASRAEARRRPHADRREPCGAAGAAKRLVSLACPRGPRR
jgi:hypothetical protein